MRFRKFFLGPNIVVKREAWKPLRARVSRDRQPVDALIFAIRYHETRRSFDAKIWARVSKWSNPIVGLLYDLGCPQLQVAYSFAARSLEGPARGK